MSKPHTAPAQPHGPSSSSLRAPAVGRAPPTLKRTLQRTLQLAWLALSYTPLGFLLSRALFVLAPQPAQYSTGNGLLFPLAPADSPLRVPRRYPARLTAGVVPKRFHAHNDYVHNPPLLEALSNGAASIEADVWLVDGVLYVGHDESDLAADRTLQSLYLDPLVEMFEEANRGNDGRMRGVFETAPHMPLHLLIDMKTDGEPTFRALYQLLAPLHAAGYLTSYTTNSPTSEKALVTFDSLVPSVLTIIGTGNTPLASVLATGADDPRYIFLDALLDALPPGAGPELCPLASADLRRVVGWRAWMAPALARPRVREVVRAAHARGIQARFWRLPGTPVATRNAVWQMLLDEGVDWLNVDDLAAARAF